MRPVCGTAVQVVTHFRNLCALFPKENFGMQTERGYSAMRYSCLGASRVATSSNPFELDILNISCKKLALS